MKVATENRMGIHRLDEGEWLCRLLADIQGQVIRQPSPQTVARIRRRLRAQIQAPTRAAA